MKYKIENKIIKAEKKPHGFSLHTLTIDIQQKVKVKSTKKS
jgi:hypothetical protein